MTPYDREQQDFERKLLASGQHPDHNLQAHYDAQDTARQARGNAALRYRQYACSALNEGSKIHSIDAEGAVAVWLDGMTALDAALEVERGL